MRWPAPTCAGGASEKLTDVLQRELDRAGLTLRGDAARVVIAHLGDDAGRIAALVDLLVVHVRRRARTSSSTT